MFTKEHVPWNKDLTMDDLKVVVSTERMARANKGRNPWNKGLTKELDPRIAHKPQAKEKIRVATLGNKNPFYGKHHSDETKQRISKKRREQWQNPIYIKNVLESKREIYISQEFAKKQSETKKQAWREGKYTKDRNLKISQTMKNMLVSREAKERQLQHLLPYLNIKPNKVENHFRRICQNHQLPYKYVGDGQVVIGSLMPDFICTNGAKAVIEIFGDYWHSSRNKWLKLRQTEKERKAIYKSLGFACLVIWEGNLKTQEMEIVRKVRRFTDEHGASHS